LGFSHTQTLAMLGYGRFHAFHVLGLQNGFSTPTRFGRQAVNPLILITMNPIMNRHLATSHNLRHLTRSAPLTLEQNHLAAPPKSGACAVLMTVFQSRSLSGIQFNDLDSWHES